MESKRIIVISILAVCGAFTGCFLDLDGESYWHLDFDLISIEEPIQFDVKADVVPYPLVNNNIEKFMDNKTDENGIPLTVLDGKDTYYPIYIGASALAHFRHFVDFGDDYSREVFLNLSEWLKENFVDLGLYGVWVCEDDFDAYSLTGPWSSAMSQGYCLAAMVQAYSLTNDPDYLAVAEKAVKAFSVNIDYMGVATYWDGDVWYEEYPSVWYPPHVLNGFIFALAGLYNVYENTGCEEAKILFDIGVDSLISKFEMFDVHFTSYYSMRPQLACSVGSWTGDGYHHIHIWQLMWLYQVTEIQMIRSMAHRFLTYDFGKSPANDSMKLQSVTADYSIDPVNSGPARLNDGYWSYGNYWSSNEFPSNLYIELDEVKSNIYQISLFMNNDKYKNIRFDLYSYDGRWQYQGAYHKPDHLYSFKTGIYETNILTYDILFPFDSERVRVRIVDSQFASVGIREIDLHFDRYEELSFYE